MPRRGDTCALREKKKVCQVAGGKERGGALLGARARESSRELPHFNCRRMHYCSIKSDREKNCPVGGNLCVLDFARDGVFQIETKNNITDLWLKKNKD